MLRTLHAPDLATAETAMATLHEDALVYHHTTSAENEARLRSTLQAIEAHVTDASEHPAALWSGRWPTPLWFERPN